MAPGGREKVGMKHPTFHCAAHVDFTKDADRELDIIEAYTVQLKPPLRV